MGGGAESCGGHVRAAPLGVREGFLGTGEKPDSLRKGSGEEVFQVQETEQRREAEHKGEWLVGETGRSY